ncbi:rhodanese-like domain-containing protein [Mordavella massiliensis]|jgi:rhodanese-related sulfurtransferase|nr:rhodanese-like domain-containing protein [Mordavella massiliensis]
MNIFSNVRRKSLQEYINEARGREGSIFLDVRTPEEYRDGHVEGSLNLPLHELKKIETLIPDKTSPVYVYCLSGARSKRSAALMGHMGYTDVTDMGGLLGQNVELVK